MQKSMREAQPRQGRQGHEGSQWGQGAKAGKAGTSRKKGQKRGGGQWGTLTRHKNWKKSQKGLSGRKQLNRRQAEWGIHFPHDQTGQAPWLQRQGNTSYRSPMTRSEARGRTEKTVLASLPTG